jgi:hypothetical protein
MAIIQNGRYEVTLATIIGSTSALVELRDGQFTGRTRLGSLMFGNYSYDEARGLHHYNCTVDIVRNGLPFLGLLIGDSGRRVTTRGEAKATDGEIRFSAGVIGRAVDVSMRYAGPLEAAA